MGGICSTDGEVKKKHRKFIKAILTRRDNLEYLGRDGSIILKGIILKYSVKELILFEW
jgi:hypothetical protein